MQLTTRLIVDSAETGVWNMAADEALLESVADGGEPALRFYQWREPTLSLGYFQSNADREQHPASRNLPVVRRSSGGGALVHDHELTYSLALPAGFPPTRDAVGLTCLVHKGIIAAVEELSSGSTRLTTCSGAIAPGETGEPFLCFLRRAEGDLLCSSETGSSTPATIDSLYKVGGSAQRKRRGAILQHGGVLLAQSAGAPELLGLADLGYSMVEARSLADVLARKLSDAIGLRLVEGGLTDAEKLAAERLAAEKFADPSWIERR